MKKTRAGLRPDPVVSHRIMDEAIQINRECPEECRDFRVMYSPMREGSLILRWTTIDISDIDRPVQYYRYRCFDPEGHPMHCSVYYADPQEAQRFFESLETLYRQHFAADHKLSGHV